MAAAHAGRNAVHLYSWFVEPIRAPSSKRWNGNVRVWGLQTPTATRWWRSSSVAAAASPTQLVTRFGTNVFLHGPLCELFASRVHMTSGGVHMFRNGFPASWKHALRSCFSSFTPLRWNCPPEKKRRASNATVSILKKPAQQQQPIKRKRVRFDFNLRPIDVPPPQPKRPRLSYACAADDRAEQAPSALASSKSRPPRSVSAPPPNIRTRSSSGVAPRQPQATAERESNAREPNPPKGSSRARTTRNASGRTTRNSNTYTGPRPGRGSSRSANSLPTTTPGSNHSSSRKATSRKSTSTLIAIPIANSSDILRIRRNRHHDATTTCPTISKASQTTLSQRGKAKKRRKRSNSVPPTPSEPLPCHAVAPNTRRTRRSSSSALECLEARAHGESSSKVTRARRLSDVSEHKSHQRRILKQTSSPALKTSSRVVAKASKAERRTSFDAAQSKLNAVSEAKPSLEHRRRSKRLSAQLAMAVGKPPLDASSESNSKKLVVMPVSRRSKRIFDRRSAHDSKPANKKQGKEDDMVETSQQCVRTRDDVLETEGHMEKETDSNEHDQTPPKQRRTKRGRPRRSRKKQLPEISGSKPLGTGERESKDVQSRRRRSTRLRVSEEDIKTLKTAPKHTKKQDVMDSASGKKDVRTGTSRQPKSTKKDESKASAKSESKSCKSLVVPFAETDRPVLRPRKRVSFGPEVKSHDAVCVPEENPAESWTAKQREDFERQRNNVPANDPRYWELVALGVEGKTAAQCLKLWESSWSSPPSTKRKKVGFADVENEPRTKRSKVSTPQVIQNVQKASKSKRSRNTAKYRTSVRRLADTFARDTEDDALEPKIVTPKMSWKLTSGTANMPSLEDGTPGTEVRQKRRNAEKGGELVTPEILKRGKCFGLKEADLYVSLFRRRLGAEPIVPTSKQAKPGVKRNLAKKPPANVAQAYEPTWYGDNTSLSDADGSQDSDSSCDGDLFF